MMEFVPAGIVTSVSAPALRLTENSLPAPPCCSVTLPLSVESDSAVSPLEHLARDRSVPDVEFRQSFRAVEGALTASDAMVTIITVIIIKRTKKGESEAFIRFPIIGVARRAYDCARSLHNSLHELQRQYLYRDSLFFLGACALPIRHVKTKSSEP